MTGFGAYPERFTHLVDLIRDRGARSVISAASHNGGEPFTLAMHLVDQGLTDVRIVAHDGRPDRYPVLQRAEYLRTEIGVDFAMGRLPERFREFFVPAEDPDRLGIHPDVRALVDVRPPCLLPWEGVEPAEIYMIRNLWIHIHPPERAELARRIRDVLPSDGAVAVRTAHHCEIGAMAPRLGDRVYGRFLASPSRVRAWRPAKDVLYAAAHANATGWAN